MYSLEKCQEMLNVNKSKLYMLMDKACVKSYKVQKNENLQEYLDGQQISRIKKIKAAHDAIKRSLPNKWGEIHKVEQKHLNIEKYKNTAFCQFASRRFM
ncbi:hypothetical protein LO80_03340 [Candidatus Francisella endociliophora]|uniref:Uncharacterized protein n=1 Tax=Candidatus Francisella endociliophora TaxID=653937 RepID=A0A097ENF4_9GAMM|nr:hypothetical protein [Francisella sp. FSC1006]AIT09097.1 hypothetical protein LO80_03340 [Francisella sp. FSC1006]